MKVCGIVVEYNPFHNGHIHHIQEARAKSGCDVLAAVMSPQFVQRGEPAICDKWTRAQAALAHGVDLVIELPTLHAVQSAAYFAKAAVSLLARLKADTLVFGSETNDEAGLHASAEKLGDIDLCQKEKSTVRQYAQALGSYAPNDILGINYIHAARAYRMKAIPIQRTNDYHDTTLHNEIASASAIRHAFFQREAISAYTPLADQLHPQAQLETLYPYLQTRLLLDDPQKMRDCFLMEEGIEGLLISAAKQSDTMEAFLSFCTNARYTRSRIRRTLLHYLLETSKADARKHETPACLRVIAFRDTARPLLRELRDEGTLIVSRFHELPLFYQQMELKATALYTYGEPLRRKQLLKKEVEGAIYVDVH